MNNRSTFLVHQSQVDAWDEIKALNKAYEAVEKQRLARIEGEYIRNFVWLAVGAILCYGTLFLA